MQIKNNDMEVDNQVIISPSTVALKRARSILKKYNPENKSLSEELISERRIEAKNE